MVAYPLVPLLLSAKGIIDLAQMPPTILLPHPGGTGSPNLDHIAYRPGPQTPFPPRVFNPASISPGEDPIPNPKPRLFLRSPAVYVAPDLGRLHLLFSALLPDCSCSPAPVPEASFTLHLKILV